MAEDYKRPGWYPDPEGKAGERWWNGSSWSETRRGGAPAPVAPPVITRPDPYAAPAPAPAPAAATRPALIVDTKANRPALIGFIIGLVSLFAFNIGGPVAIAFSIVGLQRARQLKAAGSPGASTIVIATIGLVTGAIATVILVVTVIAFIASFSFQYSDF